MRAACYLWIVLAAIAAPEPTLAAGDRCAAVEVPAQKGPASDDDKPVMPWANAPVLTAGEVPDARAIMRAAERGPVIVAGAKLAGVQFTGASLSRVCFEDSDLSGSDWSGAVTHGIAFRNSDLTGAKLVGARLAGAVFWDSALDRVDASKADLTGAGVWGGSFDGLSLHGAILARFELWCGLVVGDNECKWPEEAGVDARDADLSGARFNVYGLDNWRLEGAKLDSTVVQLNQVEAFKVALPRGPVLIESTGYDTSAHALLSVAEWRDLLAAWRDGPPSFVCAKAKGAVERAICDEGKLAFNSLPHLDERLAELYRGALARGETSTKRQRRWLRRRDACAARAGDALHACIKAAYNERIRELAARSTPPAWLRPGAEALYVDSHPLLAQSFRSTATYRRLIPVIAATSTSTLYVKGIDGRSIRATGHAMGANGRRGLWRRRRDHPPLGRRRSAGGRRGSHHRG